MWPPHVRGSHCELHCLRPLISLPDHHFGAVFITFISSFNLEESIYHSSAMPLYTMYTYDSYATNIQDQNISGSSTPFTPASFRFGKNCFIITISRVNWKILASNRIRPDTYFAADDGSGDMVHRLSYRSVRFVQQAASHQFTIFSSRKEIHVNFTSSLFENL